MSSCFKKSKKLFLAFSISIIFLVLNTAGVLATDNKAPVIGNIDNPLNGHILTGTQTISGWFLDSNGVSNIDILVDGKLIGKATSRVARGDLANGYPQYDNSKAGWNYDLDTTTISNGTHSLIIKETGGTGVQTTLTNVIVVFNDTLSQKGRIDCPTNGQVVKGIQTISGWILDGKRVSNLKVFVDGIDYGAVTYGDLRTDIGISYPQYNNNNSGYHYNLDTTKLSNGTHIIEVKESGNSGSKISLTTTVIVDNNVLPAKGSIEYPIDGQKIGGNRQITGWFLDGNGISKVDVLIDGKLDGKALYGEARPDITKLYPQYNNNNSGYHYNLDTTKFSNGTHTLEIRELNGMGINNKLTTTILIDNNVVIDSIVSSGSKVKGGSFKVTAKNVIIDSNIHISKILFPTWTEGNGQDDLIWYEGIRIPGTNDWEITINTSDHKYRSGKYFTDVYLQDSTGKNTHLGGTNVYVSKILVDSITSSPTPIGTSSYKICANNVRYEDGTSVEKVVFPTWTESNGQDDIIWHQGTRIPGTNNWEVIINRTEHKNESGNYITHIYVKDGQGKSVTCIGGNNSVMNKITTDGVVNSGSKVKGGSFKVTAKNVIIDSNIHISKILFPTWTEGNGQDDLIWYEGIRIPGTNDWEITINTSDHKYRSGKYFTDVYLQDSTGKNTHLGGTNVYVSKILVDSITSSPTPIGTSSYKICANNVRYEDGTSVEKVVFPTWTESNGQDDIIWHQGARIPGTNNWEVTINRSEHKNESGNYITHIYVRDTQDKNVTCIGAINILCK